MERGRALLVAFVVLTIVFGSLTAFEYVAQGNQLAATLTVTSTVTLTETSTVIPAQQALAAVNASFDNHIIQLSSRNASAVLSQYEENATIVWTGMTQGLSGNYTSRAALTALFTTFFHDFSSRNASIAFVIGNVTRTLGATEGLAVVVNSTFDFAGHSDVYGNFFGTVWAQDRYVYSAEAGTWLISLEAWDFKSFNIQFTVNAT